MRPSGRRPNALFRNTTGPGLITLRPSDGVDLDDVTTPSWNVGTGCCSNDVGFASDGGLLSIDGGHAAVAGPPEFGATVWDLPVPS